MPPPRPCPFLLCRMKYGFARSLTHSALASNTSSGVIHMASRELSLCRCGECVSFDHARMHGTQLMFVYMSLPTHWGRNQPPWSQNGLPSRQNFKFKVFSSADNKTIIIIISYYTFYTMCSRNMFDISVNRFELVFHSRIKTQIFFYYYMF